MPFSPPATLPRYGVVDLGSNSVRLVVYEGQTRNPTVIFNERPSSAWVRACRKPAC